MIFEDWELNVIENLLNVNKLEEFGIKTKIQNLRKTSVNKRYSLRTTDWLVESGRKRRGRKKNKTINPNKLFEE